MSRALQLQNAAAEMRLFFLVLVCVVGLAGCRMYGTADSTELVQQRLQALVLRLAAEQADKQDASESLARAAEQHAALVPLAERFAALVAAHGRLVAEYEQRVEALPKGDNPLSAWVGPDAYRALHNAYGAVVADRQLLEDKYEDVLLDLEMAVGSPPASRAPGLARYGVAPAFYARLIPGAPSLEQVLAMVPPASER